MIWTLWSSVTSIDYSFGYNTRFRYILEGVDNDWVEATEDLRARYMNAPSGTFNFRVQMFDVDGTWKELRKPLVVMIHPPWWQTLWFQMGSLLVVASVGWGFYRTRVRAITARNHQLEKQVEERTKDLAAEQKRSEALLLNVLPEAIAGRLKKGEREIADHYENVSIVFADIVGFTPLTSTLQPKETVRILNDLFSSFDRLAREIGVERIKTIGDAYMAAVGVPSAVTDHAARAARFANAIMHAVAEFSRTSGLDLHLRIGMNCGEVVAAIVGENRFAYDLWSDAVNVAARMEVYSEPDLIQATEAFALELQKQAPSEFNIELRGSIDVKGKGLMTTYWIRMN